MKIFISVLLGVCLFSFSAIDTKARNITFILIRHAEKDTSKAAYKTDVGLTPAGIERALRLFEIVKPYRPEYIFSSAVKRTLMTATPTAERLIPNRRVQVQFYDTDEMPAFAERLLKLKTRCVLVVGHNTTTPELANLLIGKEKYQPLDDNEYNKMFIIKIRGKKIEDKVIEY